MIKRCSQTAAALLFALLLAFGWTGGAQAQGVTTSAVSGRITGPQGEPVRGATVEITQTQTGAQARVVTREDGRYVIQGLQPGGPYRITVRGLGLSEQTRAGIQLTLSQTIRQDFQLSTQAVALEGLTVTADRGGVISRERTGTATVVNDSALRRLPTITRDFTDFTRLTPQISTAGEGSNAGGRNSKFNTIQIDGAANNDLFGLNAAGTPGSGSDAKPITLEAIQEFQVAIAPYDIRQGGFTGAAINAVTKRGTNRLTGSATYFTRNENLVGNYRFPESGLAAAPFEQFEQTEAGFSVGGFVIRDRLHFFVAGELNRRSAPINNVAGTGSSEVTLAEAQEVANILSSKYGYAPGELGALNLRTEGNNLFGRLDWTVSDNHRFTLRHNYVDGTRGDLDRSNTIYRLGGSLFERENTTHSTVAQLNSTFHSQFFNELRVGYSTIADERIPQDRTPSVRVFVPGSGRSIFAGSEQFSGQNILDQEALEVTNDLSFAVGRHNLTLGTHNEFFNFNNLFVRNAFGYYEFSSPEALEAGTPSRYEYSFLVPDVDPNTPGNQPGAPRSAFDVRQFSVYAQDQIDLFSGFTLTAGLRYDITTLPDEPTRNLAFEQTFKADSVTVGGRPNQFFGRQTNEVPSGNGQISPRVAFNWDVSGNRSTQLRGGVGLFAGRTPGVYVSNAYGNTGLEYVTFTCQAAQGVPAFSADPNNQPRNCTG
ncbi:MAG: TonB-dependent receptor, partial [Gemmatimonadetes bacterium]|nr:TonB-dependent receptor [Gemmatimonadota bacterium]